MEFFSQANAKAKNHACTLQTRTPTHAACRHGLSCCMSTPNHPQDPQPLSDSGHPGNNQEPAEAWKQLRHNAVSNQKAVKNPQWINELVDLLCTLNIYTHIVCVQYAYINISLCTYKNIRIHIYIYKYIPHTSVYIYICVCVYLYISMGEKNIVIHMFYLYITSIYTYLFTYMSVFPFHSFEPTAGLRCSHSAGLMQATGGGCPLP